jgi:glutaredoxin-related protein
MENAEQLKLKLFGSEHCPGCGPVKDLLMEKQVKFIYIDITSNMTRLQSFLKIRDTSPAFDSLRGGKRIGIPCLQAGDAVYIIESPEHATRLIEELGIV